MSSGKDDRKLDLDDDIRGLDGDEDEDNNFWQPTNFYVHQPQATQPKPAAPLSPSPAVAVNANTPGNAGTIATTTLSAPGVAAPVAGGSASASTSALASATASSAAASSASTSSSSSSFFPAMSSPTKTIFLISRDERRFELSRRAAALSDLIFTTIEGDKDAREVPLMLDGGLLERIVDYLVYHERIPPRKIPVPIPSNNLNEWIDRWDAKFLSDNFDEKALVKLMLCANYLNIRPLFQLCCAKLAAMLKGKDAKEIRDVLGIKHDYTAAEEEEVRREHKELIGIPLNSMSSASFS